MRAIAFTGNSNSGKTTLIEKLALYLRENAPYKRIAIIKHDPKDKAQLDTQGKDSARFFESGADVVILGNTQTTLRFHKALSIESIKTQFSSYDYLFVEGLKELPLPRICVARDFFDTRFLPFIQAIAIDSSIKKESLASYKLQILDLDNPLAILEWINTFIKDIE
ncbi:molybdopterin-guanine dinucleotide biosynthesis protein B [Helicobacter winghamensis]|uniref:Molybdopterin-guanine dinucleotide biosynthesis protein B n=1 Tax=Helicobacter winghamensis TaxID=157268 RepID=A0A2N3PI43_9HELI|nr:molybdopterin-guanine dinucleotide biosynthesis protein B [Helicobacter winghamensis]EEO26125.1 molybdopterin-guanine dinucleotide biosynthesis protein B [Helicobacter winghamensis ATCC BAA-430]PKT75735.1 molybdopterin-guanine dinucleotide biosynthesis protein B [Helicobacter winghamensis]PKT75944.1 molybdopterin-guanine dinucleotide biosynthesis protein B [Helicobacter winghamensis]PKT76181.1 molybdopterin-guanine dinucleotide biosynthesis protein B [Helicobacter winghamensis]PKT80327.1 mo